MAKKKAKRVHSPAKRLNRVAYLLRIEYRYSWGFNANGTPRYTVSLDKPLAKAITDIPRRWFLKAQVFCRAPDGSEYIEEHEVLTQEACRFGELSAVCQRVLADAEASVNPKHITDRGWLARPLTNHYLKQLNAEDAA